jgi:hypothetical protein
MGIKRVSKQLLEHHWRARRVFPPRVLALIGQATKAGEATHSGQVRFAVEGALDSKLLFKNQSARVRALDIFSQLRIWDTAHNNGVLIYLLLADRKVEIVFDRGIDAKVGAAGWQNICAAMETDFKAGNFESGVVKGGFSTTDFGAPLTKKAFDPNSGPLRDKAAPPARQKARCDLFTGAFGEIRNPKGHNDPTITDALVAAEELMAAGVLRRIVDNA